MRRRDAFAEWAALERASGMRIGAAHPADEPVRFVPDASLAFPAKDADRSENDPRVWTTRCMSLAGASSDLPPYLVEEVALEEAERPVRRALLTPFHHRATSLLFRSVRRVRIADETRSLDDAWPTRLAGMVGCDVGFEPDRALVLALAPLLHGPRSASSLVRALAVVSELRLGGAPVSFEARSAVRAHVDERDRARLGRVRLGDDAWIGATVLDRSARASIRVGPVDAARGEALRQDARARSAIAAVVRWFASTATEIDVALVVVAAPSLVGRSRLGRSALGSARSDRVVPIELAATLAPRVREASARHAIPASEEQDHASRSPSARQKAHAHCAPPPRERGDERRPRAARRGDGGAPRSSAGR